MENILVTGGMGFIGKVLVKKILTESKAKIVIVDNLSSSKAVEEITSNERVNFIEASFEDWECPKNIRFDKIYHLTSPVGPLGVLKYKGLIGRMIIDQLYVAAEMAIEHGAKLIEISTSEVYGCHPDNEEEGQREDLDKIVPSNLTVRLEYGIAKLLCEIILSNLARDNSLEYICIRPFNIVGPSQNDELGFIIPRFLKQIREGKDLTVYGDGTQKRTFTHVQDFVDATYLLMESNISGEVFNIGNPKNVSTILNLAKLIKEKSKADVDISFVDPTKLFNDFAEAWNKIPNIEKLTRATGFTPKITLEEIIDEAISMSDEYLLNK
tara:strand:+ start:8805 stop:9779 length:975 start_codon:yes stop_codon:yes gene_type:complete